MVFVNTLGTIKQEKYRKKSIKCQQRIVPLATRVSAARPAWKKCLLLFGKGGKFLCAKHKIYLEVYMSEKIKAIYKNGIIEPAEPLKIAEGTEVYVIVPKITKSASYRSVLDELRKEGFLDFDTQTISQPFHKRQRGRHKGKPVSETIIEDRGQTGVGKSIGHLWSSKTSFRKC